MNARQKAKKYKALYEEAMNQPVKYQIKTVPRNIKKFAASMLIERDYHYLLDLERVPYADHIKHLMAEKFFDAVAENLEIETEDVAANTVKVTGRLYICESEEK